MTNSINEDAGFDEGTKADLADFDPLKPVALPTSGWPHNAEKLDDEPTTESGDLLEIDYYSDPDDEEEK